MVKTFGIIIYDANITFVQSTLHTQTLTILKVLVKCMINAMIKVMSLSKYK